MAERKWYYIKDNKKMGPVPEETLKQMFQSGELDKDTLVWSDMLTEWFQASKLEVFKEEIETRATQYVQEPQSQPLAKKKMSTGAKVAIFIGIGVAVLCFIIVIIMAVESNIQTEQQTTNKETTTTEETTATTPSTTTETTKPEKPKKPEWKDLISFSGSGEKTTETFKINSDEWRVCYDIQGGDMIVFGFFVYAKGETSIYSATFSTTKAEVGNTMVYESGEFYLKIIGGNCDWAVTVQEKI